MRELIIAGRRIADDEPCYVIAEIGNNHQGSVETAITMIDAAAAAGCDAVKFQRRHNGTLYTQALLDAPYAGPQSFGPTYGAHRAALELPLSAYADLVTAAHSHGMACIATAFDQASAADLAGVPVDAIKLASGALTDAALQHAASVSGLPLILSTGGGDDGDIDSAFDETFGVTGRGALLHCTASYPAAFEELNMRCIETLRREYPSTVIGWSSHDNGIAMAVAAYALGARIIEKHFTLNRTMKGTDHAFSLEPSGMTKMCRDLARAHVAMGDGVKRWHDSERLPIAKMRRSWTQEGWKITGEVPRA